MALKIKDFFPVTVPSLPPKHVTQSSAHTPITLGNACTIFSFSKANENLFYA